MKPALLLATLAVLISPLAPLHADELDGTVLAYDRKARVIVLRDKSVIPLANLQGDMPEDLAAGDLINVRYESNEDDGIHLVHGIERLQ